MFVFLYIQIIKSYQTHTANLHLHCPWGSEQGFQRLFMGRIKPPELFQHTLVKINDVAALTDQFWFRALEFERGQS